MTIRTKAIHIPVTKPYDVIIGRGLLEQCGDLLEDILRAETCALITDDNVDPLYSDIVVDSLESVGIRTVKYVIPHGESSKSGETLLQLYSFLAFHNLTRSDCLVALGGGVVGDLTGFAAATYLRGIDYVQIPTSLLAQVDSSVGGKTAIDLAQGKNLVGAFKQPAAVICDIDTLKTLPREFLIDGMGEVIKYGMIDDLWLFDLIDKYTIDTVHEDFDRIIPECVTIKRNVVAADEFDNNERLTLNFGHTLGHAIEAHYHYQTYTHGAAVAAGMCMITRVTGSEYAYERLCNCCKRYELPTTVDAPLSALLPLCANDKKRLGGQIRYIMCEPIGQAHIKWADFDAFCKMFETQK